jgi:hypothetical protein
MSFNDPREKLRLTYGGYFGTYVLDRHKIYILDAFKCGRYNGGLGTSFYKTRDDFKPRDFTPNKDIFAFRCGSLFGLENKITFPISLYGRHDPNLFCQTIVDNTNDVFRPEQHWPSFLFYNYLFGLTDMKPRIQITSLESYADLKNTPFFNGLLWLRSHWKYNPNTGKHDIISGGNSHLGHIVPPMKNILNGAAELFKTAN